MIRLHGIWTGKGTPPGNWNETNSIAFSRNKRVEKKWGMKVKSVTGGAAYKCFNKPGHHERQKHIHAYAWGEDRMRTRWQKTQENMNLLEQTLQKQQPQNTCLCGVWYLRLAKGDFCVTNYFFFWFHDVRLANHKWNGLYWHVFQLKCYFYSIWSIFTCERLTIMYPTTVIRKMASSNFKHNIFF